MKIKYRKFGFALLVLIIAFAILDFQIAAYSALAPKIGIAPRNPREYQKNIVEDDPDLQEAKDLEPNKTANPDSITHSAVSVIEKKNQDIKIESCNKSLHFNATDYNRTKLLKLLFDKIDNHENKEYFKHFDFLKLPTNSKSMGVPFTFNIVYDNEIIKKTILLKTDDRKFGKIYKNFLISNLSPGSYNYVITSEGDVIFGLVENQAELGVKHFQLANGEGVIVAGQIKVEPKNKAIFDIESGTYTLNYMNVALFESHNPKVVEFIKSELTLLAKIVFSGTPAYNLTSAIYLTPVKPGALKNEHNFARFAIPLDFKAYCDDPNFANRVIDMKDINKVISNQDFCFWIKLVTR